MTPTPPRRRRSDSPEAGIEAEVNRRVTEIVRERDITTQLEKINVRLDAANHLKEAMVTKDDFLRFEHKQADLWASAVTVQPLGDGDFVVAFGRDISMTRAQLVAIENRADRDLRERQARESANVEEGRRSRRMEVRSVVVQAVGTVMQVVVAAVAAYLALRSLK